MDEAKPGCLRSFIENVGSKVFGQILKNLGIEYWWLIQIFEERMTERSRKSGKPKPEDKNALNSINEDQR